MHASWHQDVEEIGGTEGAGQIGKLALSYGAMLVRMNRMLLMRALRSRRTNILPTESFA